MNKKSFKEIERTTQTMGMAASQARLLTLTARLSDNELRSQTINNAKMRLSAQSSQASEAYINALNNATLKFTNYDETGAAHTQPLTFNALTAYSTYNTQYGITNTSGQLLVSEEEARMFQNANGDLNKYLKAHGLEYTTTYFEKIKDKEQPDYPEPFNYITTSQLRNWYESYGSYENSVEVDKYKKAYANFNSAKTSLNNGLRSQLNEYFGITGTGENKTSGGYTYDRNNTVANNLAAIKSAFTDSAKQNNSYNIYNETTAKFVNGLSKDGNTRKLINDTLEKYKISNDTGALNINTTSEVIQNADLTYSFRMGDVFINMDSEFHVNSVTLSNSGESDKSATEGLNCIYMGDTSNNGGITFVDGKWELKKDGNDNGPTIQAFLNAFSIQEFDDDDTSRQVSSVFGAKFDEKTQTVSMIEAYIDQEAQIEQIETLNELLISILKENVDYGKFGEYIINGGSNVNITEAVSELIKNHENTKNAFLNTIFNDINKEYQFAYTDNDGNIQVSTPAINIEEALDKNIININDLLDEEYVLWLAKNSKDADGNNLNEESSFMTEGFKTAIKSYIVEQVIEETGTPNYAWVDSMDTSNKGNADAKAQWYTNLFKRMQQGYKALENGLASSSQWLEYAIESGIVLLEQVDKSFNWQSLEFKTCTRITEETDDAAVAKAEAEYTRAMNDIKAKDNMYDIQLKNIDTEHNSLQTEYDSIKKVMDKNIDRTFKFSQNG